MEAGGGNQGAHGAPSEYVVDPGLENRIWLIEPVLIKRIISLGLPVVVGMLTQTLINQVDTFFIGRLAEDIAVPGTAALGNSVILLWAFGGFLSAISVGTQALAGRRIGEGDPKGAGKVLTNSFVLALMSSLVVTVVAISAVGFIFPWLHPDPDVQRLGISFCQIRFLGIVPMVLTASLKSFYDSAGQVRLHMWAAIVMNIVNGALCWVLVPIMQVDGAGWAAFLSSLVGAGMMIVFVLRPQDRARFHALRIENLDRSVAANIARLSVWSGIATVIVMAGFLLFQRIVGLIDAHETTGAVNAAATQLIITVTMVVFMTSIAFGTSTATLVAQSLGAKQPGLATRYGWHSVPLIVLLMAIVGGAMAAWPEAILRVFMPADLDKNEAMKDMVVAVGAGSLRFCGLVVAPIAAGALVMTQALFGAGESRFVMLVEGGLHFLCLVPLAYLFSVSLGFGLIGCWYATAVYAGALFAATAWRFGSGVWQKTVL